MTIRSVALLLCLAYTPARADEVFTWVVGKDAIDMGSTDDKFCFLTIIQGRITSPNEEVHVQATGGHWFLGGTSQHQGVGAYARCLGSQEFGKASDTRMISDEIRLADVASCNAVRQDAWWGDAVTAISAVGGVMTDSHQSVSVEQSSLGQTPSHLAVSGCSALGKAPRRVSGAAYSYFSGSLGAFKPAMFVGPGGTGAANVAKEFSAGSNSTVTLADAGLAMCVLSYVSGQFHGEFDSVGIYAGQNWILKTRSSKGSGGIAARARCFLRHP